MSVKGYVNNILKELREVGSSNVKLDNARYNAQSYPPNDMATGGKGREYWGQVANKRAKDARSQEGQLMGAILQGRRYDKKGTQITGQTQKLYKLNKNKKK